MHIRSLYFAVGVATLQLAKTLQKTDILKTFSKAILNQNDAELYKLFIDGIDQIFLKHTFASILALPGNLSIIDNYLVSLVPVNNENLFPHRICLLLE